MTVLQAIQQRHSVRSYNEQKIPDDVVSQLTQEIEECNKQSGLNIQLITDEPKAFDGMMAHYGKFSAVHNYIALIGPKESRTDESVGYYGEKIALKAQTLGLNTCWVAMSFSKGAAKKNCVIGKNEKIVCVLALGYGATQGVPHNSKPMDELYKSDAPVPDWFINGMQAAMLAPTAMNQQKFLVTLKDGEAAITSLGGFYSNVDLGIVKYHFEIGSGKKLN